MATDTIRVPSEWKPLLQRLKNSVTAEKGEALLRDLLAGTQSSSAEALVPETALPIPSPAPLPTAPTTVRLILRNEFFRSVVLAGQRYPVDQEIEVSPATAAAIAQAVAIRQPFGRAQTTIEQL